MKDITLTMAIHRAVDEAAARDEELDAKQIRAAVMARFPDIAESSVSSRMTDMVEDKQLRKKRPKVKRAKRCFVYVLGSVVPEGRTRGRPKQLTAHVGFMKAKRDREKAKRKALAA